MKSFYPYLYPSLSTDLLSVFGDKFENVVDRHWKDASSRLTHVYKDSPLSASQVYRL